MVVLRQKNQQATSNTDLRCQPRAFGAHRILEHLHHQGLTFKQLLFDGFKNHCSWSWRRNSPGNSSSGRFRVCMPAGNAAHQIGHMQKGGTIQANIDKG